MQYASTWNITFIHFLLQILYNRRAKSDPMTPFQKTPSSKHQKFAYCFMARESIFHIWDPTFRAHNETMVAIESYCTFWKNIGFNGYWCALNERRHCVKCRLYYSLATIIKECSSTINMLFFFYYELSFEPITSLHF